jgi:hypothetical protein
MLAGRDDLNEPLAGKSTLNRMELGAGRRDRYKKITFWKEGLDELLVQVFVESYDNPPAEIVLDVDTTDLPLHGSQEGRFFHGYYDNYCYAALHFLRRTGSVCAIARSQSRRGLRQLAGNTKNRGADSAGVADREDHSARGFRLLPKRIDELV